MAKTNIPLQNGMKFDTQCDRLLQALKGGPINPMQAWERLGIYRLGARVFDLKSAGHTITAEKVTVLNKFGEECRVAQYRLAGGAK